jgi:hypothetical protein
LTAAATPPVAAVPVVPVPAYRDRCCFSTSMACEALGTCDRATFSPGGTTCAAFAAADASPVATAVVAVAASPPIAARTMVDTIVLRETLCGSGVNPELSNGRTTFCYADEAFVPFCLAASASMTSLGSKA